MDELRTLILNEIGQSGPMSFARFMELALYHPEYGYYGSGRARIGKGGDYYTSPHMGPVFGALMAEWYVRLMPFVGEGCVFVEMGAGEGLFAADFMAHLMRCHPDASGPLEYHIVERAAGMQALQEKSLAGLSGRVRWHASLEEMAGPVRGVFFSNELVDSFPFHRVAMAGGALREIYVGLENGALIEVTGEPSTPAIPEYFEALGITLPEGATSEVNLAALGWMAEVSARLERGFVITLDYGYDAGEYYSPLRRRGTLMCYKGHTAGEEPYKDIGGQDITAHADFSALALAGAGAGLLPLLFTDQTSFFIPAAAGLEAALAKAGASQEEMERVSRGLVGMMHPDMMGGAFKALVQGGGGVDGGPFAGMRNRAGQLAPGGA